MQNNRFSHARRFFLSVAAALGLFLLTGCEMTITNLTPASLPENPSQIYTISTRVTPKTNAIIDGSIVPRLIIDGKSVPMNKSALGQGIYEVDYQIPAGRTEIAYYVLVNYQVENNGTLFSRESFTEVQHAQIVSRYVLSLEVSRGPVGSRISILGRGFTAQDVVYLDGAPARTMFESPTSISFFVPPVEANRNYKVQIGNSAGTSLVGTFRVDGTTIAVSPSSLNLSPGKTQTLTFTLPYAAPTGGLLLDVTTDIPECVIMPEVMVPAGQTTVVINVQGGRPGSGSLYLKGYGAGDVTVPVTVR